MRKRSRPSLPTLGYIQQGYGTKPTLAPLVGGARGPTESSAPEASSDKEMIPMEADGVAPDEKLRVVTPTGELQDDGGDKGARPSRWGPRLGNASNASSVAVGTGQKARPVPPADDERAKAARPSRWGPRLGNASNASSAAVGIGQEARPVPHVEGERVVSVQHRLLRVLNASDAHQLRSCLVKELREDLLSPKINKIVDLVQRRHCLNDIGQKLTAALPSLDVPAVIQCIKNCLEGLELQILPSYCLSDMDISDSESEDGSLSDPLDAHSLPASSIGAKASAFSAVASTSIAASPAVAGTENATAISLNRRCCTDHSVPSLNYKSEIMAREALKAAKRARTCIVPEAAPIVDGSKPAPPRSKPRTGANASNPAESTKVAAEQAPIEQSPPEEAKEKSPSLNVAKLLGAELHFPPAQNDGDDRPLEAVVVGRDTANRIRYICNGEEGVINLTSPGEEDRCPRLGPQMQRHLPNSEYLHLLNSDTSEATLDVIARNRLTTPVNAAYFIDPATQLPMYADELLTHPNPAIAMIAGYWNDMMGSFTHIRTKCDKRKVPVFIAPLFSDILLKTLGPKGLLYIFWYCYSPLAIHDNAIGRMQSSEARGPNGELLSNSWGYNEHCLTPKCLALGALADVHITSFTYNGELRDILSEENARFVERKEAGFIRAILNCSSVRVQLLSKGARTKVASALGDAAGTRQNLNAFHVANPGRFVSMFSTSVSAPDHGECHLNKDYVAKRTTEQNRTMSISNDLHYSRCRVDMGKTFGFGVEPCTVTLDLHNKKPTATTTALEDMVTEGTLNFLIKNANSVVPALHPSNPANIIAYALKRKEALLKLFPELESMENATLTHLHREMWLGKTHTEASKAEMSKAKMGNTNWRGKTHTEASKAKLSKANVGKTASGATKAKMSETAAKKNLPEWLAMAYKLQNFSYWNPEYGCCVPGARNAETKARYERDLVGWTPKLANWVTNQRKLKRGKGSKITQKKIDLLDAIGFVWKPKTGAGALARQMNPV